MITGHTILYATLGGFVPALFWLWFWLREDTIHQEPRKIIILTFLAGMLAAPLAFPFEKWVSNYEFGMPVTFLLWAAIEETLKFFAAYVVALDRKDDAGPVGALLYLITAALGFTAMENTFFLLTPLASGDIVGGLLTGNLRFIGASLLHTVSSGILGITLGISMHMRHVKRDWHLFVGFLFAIALHSAFNFFIIQNEGNDFLKVFAFLWIVTIIVMLLFEKVRRLSEDYQK